MQGQRIEEKWRDALVRTASDAGMGNTTRPVNISELMPAFYLDLESLPAVSDSHGFEWRIGFIKTCLERDSPQFCQRIPAATPEES